MGYESTTNEFRSDALTHWAIRLWVQLVLRANFVELLQLHCLLSVVFHFGHCLRQSPPLFSSKFSGDNHMSLADWVDACGIHHWMIAWSGYKKLNRVGFEPTTTGFSWDPLNHWAIKPWVQFVLRANLVQLLQLHGLWNVILHFGHCLSQWPRLFLLKLSGGNHMSVAEWANTYGIQHWMILWIGHRKLAWVGLESTITEFHSDALTQWAIRLRVQFVLRGNFVRLFQLHHLSSVRFHFDHCLSQSSRFF